MKFNHFFSAFSATAFLLLPLTAAAGPGHDHGADHGPAAPSSSGPASPRFAATSETFELVGVLKGQQITLYLDRVADNSPVLDAQIDIELGGIKLQAKKQGADEFELTLPTAAKPGTLTVVATVTVGAEVDLLAADLDVPAPASTETAGHEHTHAHTLPWKQYASYGAVGLLIVAGLMFAARRMSSMGRMSKLRQRRAGGLT